MICKMCKNLNQYKILVYRGPPLMCNLTNKALAIGLYLFKMLASCLILENVNLERMAPTGNQSTGAVPLVPFIPGDPTLVG